MRRREFVSWGLGATVAFGVSPARVLAGACAPPTLGPTYLTAEEATLPPDGGVLLGLSQRMSDERIANPFHGPYVIAAEHHEIPTSVSRVAPGLARLHLRGDRPEGPCTVRGPAGERRVRFDGPPIPALPRPDVRRIEIRRFEGSTQPYSPGGWTIVATLRSSVPARVLGAITYAAANPTALLFATATVGSREVVLYGTPGRCQSEMPNSSPPAIGDSVRIAWMDDAGRVSNGSSEIEVDD